MDTSCRDAYPRAAFERVPTSLHESDGYRNSGSEQGCTRVHRYGQSLTAVRARIIETWARKLELPLLVRPSTCLLFFVLS